MPDTEIQNDDPMDDPFANLETGFPVESVRTPKPIPAHYLPPKMSWPWLTRADELGGGALAVGLVVLRNHARTAPYGWPNRIGLESGEPFGLKRWAVRNGLKLLADGGLIRLEMKPGSKAVVEILKSDSSRVMESDWLASTKQAEFIYLKIPMDWISRAAKCQTPGLIMGLAAWRYDFMTKIPGESRFSIHPLAGSNRSTSALRRGLVALESAGLVKLMDAPRGFVRLKIVKPVALESGGSDHGDN